MMNWFYLTVAVREWSPLWTWG